MTQYLQPRRFIFIITLISTLLLTACNSDNDKMALADSTIKSETSASYWMDIANTIQNQVNEAVSLAEKGDIKLATRTITQTYFQQFEGSKMETAIRIQISPKHMLKVEGLFGALRKSIKEQADSSTLKEQAKAIIDAVTKDAKELDDAGIDAALLEDM